ncbi:hypothetical protein ACH5RR_024410 [Cinchona calisaya]|uniref:Splicing factor Cactin C-terminal domain-containing protein n=1 Tax=Cinchona calisaya TaxID=153742 RepID=A0ABD2YWN3_9GENT
MAEIGKAKKRREERAIEKAHHQEEIALLARERARVELEDLEGKDEEFSFNNQSKKLPKRLTPPNDDNLEKMALKAMGVIQEGDAIFGSNDEINLDSQVYWCSPRKPKYFNRIHTGYEWNKYNQLHYDHDNPPPKIVKGCKFNIFYPDLVDTGRAPTYAIEKDGDSWETRIIRFHMKTWHSG